MTDENSAAFERYLTVEQQNDSLANLYVSAYRLHGTLDPAEVLRAIQEIVVNLVGSEEFAIFERSTDGASLQLVAAVGVDATPLARIPIGSGRIGGVAVSGEAFLAADGMEDPAGLVVEAERRLTACVPLRIDGEVTGAIAIFRLLEQKPGLERIDFEIFDLLASQAATALHAARLHARYWRAGGDGGR
jgi:GAF domain-containing protein